MLLYFDCFLTDVGRSEQESSLNSIPLLFGLPMMEVKYRKLKYHILSGVIQDYQQIESSVELKQI